MKVLIHITHSYFSLFFLQESDEGVKSNDPDDDDDDHIDSDDDDRTSSDDDSD